MDNNLTLIFWDIHKPTYWKSLFLEALCLLMDCTFSETSSCLTVSAITWVKLLHMIKLALIYEYVILHTITKMNFVHVNLKK